MINMPTKFETLMKFYGVQVDNVKHDLTKHEKVDDNRFLNKNSH